jgi:hypothetical protein
MLLPSVVHCPNIRSLKPHPVRRAARRESTRDGLAKQLAETKRSPCINHKWKRGKAMKCMPMQPFQ